MTELTTKPTDSPLYIEYNGQKYVRLDYCLDMMNESAKNGIEAAAYLVQGYPAVGLKQKIQLASDIRSLKEAIDDDTSKSNL